MVVLPRSERKHHSRFRPHADFQVSRDWRGMDFVQVRSALGHTAHVLRMRHYQVTLLATAASARDGCPARACHSAGSLANVHQHLL